MSVSLASCDGTPFWNCVAGFVVVDGPDVGIADFVKLGVFFDLPAFLRVGFFVLVHLGLAGVPGPGCLAVFAFVGEVGGCEPIFGAGTAVLALC